MWRGKWTLNAQHGYILGWLTEVEMLKVNSPGHQPSYNLLSEVLCQGLLSLLTWTIVVLIDTNHHFPCCNFTWIEVFLCFGAALMKMAWAPLSNTGVQAKLNVRVVLPTWHGGAHLKQAEVRVSKCRTARPGSRPGKCCTGLGVWMPSMAWCSATEA